MIDEASTVQIEHIIQHAVAADIEHGAGMVDDLCLVLELPGAAAQPV